MSKKRSSSKKNEPQKKIAKLITKESEIIEISDEEEEEEEEEEEKKILSTFDIEIDDKIEKLKSYIEKNALYKKDPQLCCVCFEFYKVTDMNICNTCKNKTHKNCNCDHRCSETNCNETKTKFCMFCNKSKCSSHDKEFFVLKNNEKTPKIICKDCRKIIEGDDKFQKYYKTLKSIDNYHYS